MSVCMCVCLCVCMSVCLCVCPMHLVFTFLRLYHCLLDEISKTGKDGQNALRVRQVWLYECMYVCLCVCLSVCMSVCPMHLVLSFRRLYHCLLDEIANAGKVGLDTLSVPQVCLSVCVSVCLCVCLSVCLSDASSLHLPETLSLSA